MPNNKEYDREKAVAYARRWALSRNPKYLDFHGLGGDCTNFCSQCIFAGSGIMNYTPVYGWYYNSANDRTPSWTGVKYLYNFLVGNKGVGPYAKEVAISEIRVGDLIQLGNRDNHYYHSLVVVSVGSVPDFSNILIATHTFDAWNRPLNTYVIEKVRFLHIAGVQTG